MKILYDAHGGDHGPLEVVKGALKAKEELGIEPVFVGDKEEINKELAKLNQKEDAIEIIEAKDTITNEDEPVEAIRKKKESSMVVALSALAEGGYDGLISTGSTGALLAGGLLIVKRMNGIRRSPIALNIPTLKGKTLLLDGGANVDTDANILEQFAIMGSIYSSEALEIEKPTVGLLNIGVESNKGNNLTKEAYQLLSQNELINFVGNIEADKVPFGAVDILIADGFSGNVLLKMYEGSAKMFGYVLKESLSKIEDIKLAASITEVLSPLNSMINYSDIAGAPLLGLNKPVFKAHGNSKAEEIVGASKMMVNYINNEVVGKLSSHLDKS